MTRFLISFLLLFSVAVTATETIDNEELLKIKSSNSTIFIDINTKEVRQQEGTIQSPNNKESSLVTLLVDVSILTQVNPESDVIIYSKDERRLDIAKILLNPTQQKNQRIHYLVTDLIKLKKRGLLIKDYDRYKGSILYSKPIKVIDGLYTAIGATQPPSYSNYGHNNNLSFIVGGNEVVVFNAGGSYLLAQAFHEEIKKITKLPIRYLIYENHQAHATMGSTYWKEQGVKIIAHQNTKTLLENNTTATSRAKRRLRDHYFKSGQVLPDITFEKKYNLNLSGISVELIYFGEAHEVDDIALWIPKEKLLISGDLIFNERMLPIQTHTNIRSWIELLADLKDLDPKIIIPGHGRPTGWKNTELYTGEYLRFLLGTVESIIEEDGDLIDAISVDTSRFKDFHLYSVLSKQNLERLFRKMEFE